MSHSLDNVANRVLRSQSAIAQGVFWMKQREPVVLAIAVAFQFIVLVSMIVLHAAPLLYGEKVIVKVVPVDPRDLFRGDYVILSYDFSTFPPDGIDGLLSGSYEEMRRHQGRTVYAVLTPASDGSYSKVEKLTFQKPSSGTFLRGQIDGWNRVKFGIEAYYLQEGEGLKYEQAIQSGGLYAELAVAPNGTAKLRQLHILPTGQL